MRKPKAFEIETESGSVYRLTKVAREWHEACRVGEEEATKGVCFGFSLGSPLMIWQGPDGGYIRTTPVAKVRACQPRKA